MPVIVDNKSTRTVVLDRGRTAAIVQNRPSALTITGNRTAEALRKQTHAVGVASTGVQGPPGPPGANGAGYTHQQPVASATWTINHNLGYRPAVELFDSGSQEVSADVAHPDVNTTIVTFVVPTAGFARLN